MKNSAKRAASALAVLLTLVFLLLPLTAAAAGGNPVDPIWEGKTAKWKAPAKTVDHYALSLYMNGYYLSDYSTEHDETYYDFTDTIKNSGPGEYKYTVMAWFTDGKVSDIIESAVLTYKGEPHPHAVKHVDSKYPTCTENGVKEHYECPVCDKYFWDSMCLNEITDKTEVILPATGHDWGDWVTTKQPTATEEGEAKRVCKNDANHVETKVLPKLDTTTAPVTKVTTTAPSTTEDTTSAETQPTTDPGAAVTHGTLPATTAPGSNSGSEEAGKIFGLPVGWFIALLVGGILLLVVTPLAVILIVVLAKRKSNPQPPLPPNGQPVMNGSEYLPPQNRNPNRSQYPPQNHNPQQYPPQNHNQQQYPPQNPNRSQYPPQDPNQQQYPPQDPNRRY